MKRVRLGRPWPKDEIGIRFDQPEGTGRARTAVVIGLTVIGGLLLVAFSVYGFWKENVALLLALLGTITVIVVCALAWGGGTPVIEALRVWKGKKLGEDGARKREGTGNEDPYDGRFDPGAL